MTQDERNTLLVDLCARLPYDVIIKNKYSHIRYNFNSLIKDKDGEYLIDGVARLDEIEIYLRPMSSMTEDEFKKLATVTELQYDQLELMDWGNDKTLEFYLSEVPQYCVIKVFDWLNKKQFDYRGMITMGLALEAPEGMYNTKTE